MKKIILSAASFGAIFYFTSCKHEEQDPMKKAVKEYVQNAAPNGMDVKYKSEKFAVIDTFTAKKEIDGWYTSLKAKGQNVSDSQVDTLIDHEVAADTAPEMKDNYDFYSFAKKELVRLKAMKPADIDFYLVNDKYSIQNPLLNQEVKIDRTYLISADDKIIAKYDDMDLNDYDKYGAAKYMAVKFFNNKNKQ